MEWDSKARIARESTAGGHLRGEQEEFEEPEDVMFEQDLVIKSLRSQSLDFPEAVCGFQSEGQEISVDGSSSL